MTTEIFPTQKLLTA